MTYINVAIRPEFAEAAQAGKYDASPALASVKETVERHHGTIAPVFPGDAEPGFRQMFIVKVDRAEAVETARELKALRGAVSEVEVAPVRRLAH